MEDYNYDEQEFLDFVFETWKKCRVSITNSEIGEKERALALEIGVKCKQYLWEKE